MVVNNGRLKRMRSSGNCRRRVTADLPDLFDFPAACDGVGVAPFRSSVRCFLERHARPTFTPSLFPCLMKWQILFRIGDLVVDDGGDGDPAIVALDIVEEDVTRSTSRSVYCDQCRVVGWSGHPVCRKRYHFIIRRSNGNGDNNGQLVQQQLEEKDKGVGSRGHHKSCTMCGNLLHSLDSRNRCKSCNYVITTDEDDDDLVEDWVYLQLEDTSHLLHGVVHSNGFGHLLTLNGREGGSTILSGRDIIDFWDKLCKTLAVRKVSVMDVSKKYGMEYRLLHAITNSHSWYSNWGYEFGAGSYALTLDAYRKAVQTLSNTPISLFYFQGRHRTSPTQLQALITFYQSISEEDSPFVSLRDLFSFILKLIHESHRSTTTTKNETRKKPKYTTTTTNCLCAWTMNDVESVEQAMIKVLLAAAAASDTPSWVSRRALKGALCKVTSPELLNYCLKHLAGKMAPNGMVVNSRCNPTSSAVEFRLEPFGFLLNQDGTNSNRPSEEHLIHDLKFLYDCILYPNTMLSYRSHVKRELIIDSATKILDCKQFVKDYKLDKMAADTRTSAIYIWCHVEVADHPKDDPLPPPPPELLILPQNASVADLKLEATKAFQEVYVLFKRLEIDEVLDYGPLDDSMTLKLLVGSTGSIRVRGKCLGTHGLSRFRMERGTENWTVDCRCGAKDDDGERMLACDTCGIWQHTRCAGINYYDAIPAKFVCMRCLNSYREASKDAQFDEAAKMGMLYSRTCRNEAATTNSSKLGSNLTITLGVPLM
ncbi:PHD finger protein [Camellia lanceoleosa]|uniref:PHD finger protein n=1 Tax=Camellia lanceoleosa TaxID=1840588 RepID=A0ACC0IFJ6_9ERIC|nr:PHD finger protein [Camellia lanceoleosa]